MSIYHVELYDFGDGGPVEADNPEDAVTFVQDNWLEECEDSRTEHHLVTVYDSGSDDREELLRDVVSIDPPEPSLRGTHFGQHIWVSPWELVGGLKENPGVWGQGGGVKYTEISRFTGHYRITNTWAEPYPGHISTTIEYHAPDYDSLEWVNKNMPWFPHDENYKTLRHFRYGSIIPKTGSQGAQLETICAPDVEAVKHWIQASYSTNQTRPPEDSIVVEEYLIFDPDNEHIDSLDIWGYLVDE